MENTFSGKISKFIASRAETKIEQFEKKAQKRRKEIKNSEDLSELESILIDEKQKLEEQFNPGNWITNAANRSKQRQLVTHALKFSHPYAKGNSVYFPGGPQHPENMNSGSIICTVSLTSPDIDSVGNAAALDVTAFLQLSHEKKTLINYIQQGDTAPLEPFALDDTQLKQWMTGFKEILIDDKLRSHTLSKQIYFPIQKDQYHLISPLYPSSLVHAIHQRITDSRFSEKAKIARKSKREAKYSADTVMDFPDTAIQSFGGTKTQNISQLNNSRGGKSFLLSCRPPSWQKHNRPPLGVKTVFSKNHFGSRVWREILELRRFLESQVGKSSTMDIRGKRGDMIDKIIDNLIQYSAEIQNFRKYAGWSGDTECKLPRFQQLWLDPHRSKSDNLFKQEREMNNWQTEVADQFAFWLNSRIKSKQLTPGDDEHTQWQKLMESKLRLLKEDLETFA
jgi:CRISPR-associated protein Csy1